MGIGYERKELVERNKNSIVLQENPHELERPFIHLILGYCDRKTARILERILKNRGVSFLYLPRSGNGGEIIIGFYKEDSIGKLAEIAGKVRIIYNSLAEKNSLYKKLAEEYPKLKHLYF